VTWLQQLILMVLAAQSLSANALAGECEGVAHVPDASVHHQPQGVDAGGGLALEASQLDVPVVVDVLQGKGSRSPITGETLIGIVTTDGRNVTLQGPSVNEAEPVVLGPDCKPLEPR